MTSRLVPPRRGRLVDPMASRERVAELGAHAKGMPSWTLAPGRPLALRDEEWRRPSLRLESGRRDPPILGAAPLRGRHLRPRLSRELAWLLRLAIWREEGRRPSLRARQLLKSCPPEPVVGWVARLRCLLLRLTIGVGM